jgi:glucose-6-phosphate 1-dehydrogenase
MDEVTFVILGATGDLTARKIIPAIYHLVERKKIQNFVIVGAARKKKKISTILNASKKFVKKGKDSVWNKLEKHASYVQLDFYNEDHYQNLQDELHRLEHKFKLPGKRIFYLATLSNHFETITHNLKKYDDKKHTKSWPRVVYEKPFGHDLKSAKVLNRHISRLFHQDHIYRIDHYLGKESVENISIVRFTNRVLEPIWNAKHIESVQIIMNESIGIEGRGSFYDKYGAIKDVVQNHMLQLLALVAMEPPKRLFGKYMQDAKVAILKRTYVESVLLGQYNGYTREPGVKKGSKTETFATLKLSLHTKRWKGVPFFFKTGKFLKSKETRIDVKFKEVKCLMLNNCPTDTNFLTIRIQPNEGITLDVHSKVPGEKSKITTVPLDFSQQSVTAPETPEAYETLLGDVIEGNQSTFVRHDEIEASWKITDAIRKGKVYHYRRGSNGPLQLQKWSKRHKIQWRA